MLLSLVHFACAIWSRHWSGQVVAISNGKSSCWSFHISSRCSRGAPAVLWGSKTPSRLRVARHCSFLDLVVFKRRLTAVHHDGVELERTPLLEHLERPVARPQRRVRVPPLQFFFEELLVMPGKPPGELVFIFDLNQEHTVYLVDLGQGQGVRGGGGIGGVDPI